MNDHDRQHFESSANSLACYIAAVQGDSVGLAVLLDSMSPLELRRVATAALNATADMTTRGNSAPSQGELARMIDILKAKVAELRVQAMQSG